MTTRVCGHCHAIVGQDPANERGPDFHDPCIRALPGVLFACCGHAGVEVPYVAFDDGLAVYGRAAIEVMEMIGGHPPREPVRPTTGPPFVVIGPGYRKPSDRAGILPPWESTNK